MVEGVQAQVTAKKLIAVAAFANSCDNKSEVKATFLAGTAFSDDLVQTADLKQAWRDAVRKVEMKLSKTTPDVSSREDLESALPQQVQVELEMAFMRRYSWHRIGSMAMGCDKLVGTGAPRV